jgi:hypothetical protein
LQLPPPSHLAGSENVAPAQLAGAQMVPDG